MTIGKVNNKLDIFGVNGFRTNTGPEYNKKLREKLSNALLPGLRWIVGDCKKSISSLVAGTSSTDGSYSTMAMSRKDLMKIFDQYDHELNTAAGRTKCMNQLIQSAADTCGVDRKFFFNVYLRPLMSEETLKKYERIADVNVSDVTKMVWNESAFINFMSCLVALCNTALVKLDIEKTLKNSIVPVINQRVVKADGPGHLCLLLCV